MKNKFLKTIAVALVCGSALSFVGCSTPTKSKNKGDAFVPVEFDTTQKVTLNLYSTMSTTKLVPIFDTFIEDFKEMYPNIEVNHTQPGSYDDVASQISTELAVGEGPDIAYCYADHVALFNKTNKVIKLDNLIASTQKIQVGEDEEIVGLTQAQQDDFIKGYYEEGKSFGDGYMYTLPFSKSTEVLYYNKTFFAEHNLTVPTTWDEMEAVCKQIKEIDPNSIPLGYDSDSNWFITMCEQYKSPYTSATGEHFLFNNDTNKAFVKKFKDWYDKGYVTTQAMYNSYTSGLFTATGAEEQKCYMCVGSSAGASYQIPSKDAEGNYPFETGITSIPQVDAKNNPKVISQGPSLCIFDQKDPQKTMAAWLLMKFMTTNVDFQAGFSIGSGYVPVIKSVNENEVYKAHIAKYTNGNAGITALSSKVCLEQEAWYYTSPAFIGSSQARTQVGNIMSTVFSSTESDIDTVINKAFSDAVYQCKYDIGEVQ